MEHLAQIKQVMKSMIEVTDDELENFLQQTYLKTYKRNSLLSEQNQIPNEIYFINQGIIRVLITDTNGVEHTIHFALENQFIADYASFIQQQPAIYSLQALEETQVLVLPRNTIDWGYNHLKEGQKMGRLVAEFYFIYQDNRINNTYIKTPKQRYDAITQVFPNIHNRAPQHMIASYLGITPIHLSRLKKESK